MKPAHIRQTWMNETTRFGRLPASIARRMGGYRSRSEVEQLLHDLAFALHATARVRDAIADEETATARS